MALLSMTSSAIAQQATIRVQASSGETKPADSETTEFTVFLLKQPLAQEAELVIRQLLGNPDDVKIVGDSAGRMWVSASPQQLKTVEQIIKVLDQPVPKKLDEVKIFPLENAEAASAAELLIQLYPDTAIAVDQRTNSLVVTAPEEQTQILEAILTSLDTQGQAVRATEAQQNATTYQIELFWLVEATGEDDGADESASRKPDPRLAEVVHELTSTGYLTNLQQLGEARVAVASGAQFTTTSSNSAGRIEASGSLTREAGEHVSLTLNLVVQEILKGIVNGRGSVTTEVVTRRGHSVILGIAGASADERRSVFVVRVE